MLTAPKKVTTKDTNYTIGKRNLTAENAKGAEKAKRLGAKKLYVMFSR